VEHKAFSPPVYDHLDLKRKGKYFPKCENKYMVSNHLLKKQNCTNLGHVKVKNLCLAAQRKWWLIPKNKKSKMGPNIKA
jgi:hypothetical protein